MTLRPALLLAALVACAPIEMEPGARVQVHPDARGLAVTSNSFTPAPRIDFGRSPEGVIAALDRELGPHRDLALTGCSADIVRQLAWDDLILSFGPERFVGWRQGSGRAGQTCA